MIGQHYIIVRFEGGMSQDLSRGGDGSVLSPSQYEVQTGVLPFRGLLAWSEGAAALGWVQVTGALPRRAWWVTPHTRAPGVIRMNPKPSGSKSILGDRRGDTCAIVADTAVSLHRQSLDVVAGWRQRPSSYRVAGSDRSCK